MPRFIEAYNARFAKTPLEKHNEHRPLRAGARSPYSASFFATAPDETALSTKRPFITLMWPGTEQK